MLGSLRLALAIAVMISHTPGRLLSINPGVVAVIGFYFISGYLMQLSYTRFQRHSSTPVRTFYLDRLLKLGPQYLLMVGVSFFVISRLGPSNWLPILNQDPSVLRVLLNLLLIPANYIFEPFVIDALLPHPIVPPAWSLATEAQFYLLLPGLFLLGTRAWSCLLVVILCIQAGSFFFPVGAYNADSFGYRYLFGVLTFFLFGFAYSRWSAPAFRAVSLAIWAYFVVMLLILGPLLDLFAQRFVFELLLGGSLALPALYLATFVPLRAYKRVDRYLGDLGYPVFISHFLGLYLAEKIFGSLYQDWWGYFGVALVITLMISVALQQLQRPLEAYRIRRRSFESLNR